MSQQTQQSQEESGAESLKGFSRGYSEQGLATLLVVMGAILFVFPEPVTSVAGAVLMMTGVVTWVSDWLWG